MINASPDQKSVLRDYYAMKADTIELIEVPVMQFIECESTSALNWTGLPEESGWPIPKIVNLIKKFTKDTIGYQFKLMPPEYVWHERHVDGRWSVTQAMHVPDRITIDMYEEARWALEKRHKNEAVPPTRFVTAQQGLCLQKLHIGHHNDTMETYKAIAEYADEHGYGIRGDRRDILVHWCAPEPVKWEKIVRVPVQKGT